MSNLKSSAIGQTKNGGRILHGGGGYLIGQANPQLHHPPHVITTEEARTNAALDAISRVVALLDAAPKGVVDVQSVRNVLRGNYEGS